MCIPSGKQYTLSITLFWHNAVFFVMNEHDTVKIKTSDTKRFFSVQRYQITLCMVAALVALVAGLPIFYIFFWAGDFIKSSVVSPSYRMYLTMVTVFIISLGFCEAFYYHRNYKNRYHNFEPVDFIIPIVLSFVFIASLLFYILTTSLVIEPIPTRY